MLIVEPFVIYWYFHGGEGGGVKYSRPGHQKFLGQGWGSGLFVFFFWGRGIMGLFFSREGQFPITPCFNEVLNSSRHKGKQVCIMVSCVKIGRNHHGS